MNVIRISLWQLCHRISFDIAVTISCVLKLIIPDFTLELHSRWAKLNSLDCHCRELLILINYNLDDNSVLPAFFWTCHARCNRAIARAHWSEGCISSRMQHSYSELLLCKRHYALSTVNYVRGMVQGWLVIYSYVTMTIKWFYE